MPPRTQPTTRAPRLRPSRCRSQLRSRVRRPGWRPGHDADHLLRRRHTTTTTTTPTNHQHHHTARLRWSTKSSHHQSGVMLSVNPATCLVAGTSARIEGSGLGVSQKGGVTECSTAAGQNQSSFGGLVLPLAPRHRLICRQMGTVPSVPPISPSARVPSDLRRAPALSVLRRRPRSPPEQPVLSPTRARPRFSYKSRFRSPRRANRRSTAVGTAPGIPTWRPLPRPRRLGRLDLSWLRLDLSCALGGACDDGPYHWLVGLHGAGAGIWTLALVGLLLIDLGYLCVTTVDKPQPASFRRTSSQKPRPEPMR